MKVRLEALRVSSWGLEWYGLIGLVLFTLLAVAGYGIFALDPSLIPNTDSARRFYGLSFGLFAKVHIVLAALVLAVPLIRRAGGRWIPAFIAVYLASFLSEHLGTGYGIPFGDYEYTSLLGYKLAGRVPALIPLSWFFMALPSWALAGLFFPGRRERVGRVLLGAYFLTAWDLALDPAMSHLTPYWSWEAPGAFYGMPWVNLLGWLGTGTILMGLLELTGARAWGSSISTTWFGAYYGAVLLMPLGMVAAAGLWWAVLATGLALAIPAAAPLGLRILVTPPLPSLQSRRAKS